MDSKPTQYRIHLRRLVSPSEEEMSAVLRVMRLTFQHDPGLRLVLAGDMSPARIDGLHRCYLRSALVEGEGEVWVAEVEVPTVPTERDIVGAAVWFLPGAEFLGSARQRQAARWNQFAPQLGERQERWFLDYFLHDLHAFWDGCSTVKGETTNGAYFCSKLAVLPEYANRGIAVAFLRTMLERCAREGNCVLGQATNERSMLMYRALGANILGAADFFPDGVRFGGVRFWAIEFRPEVLTTNSHWTPRTFNRPDPSALARL